MSSGPYLSTLIRGLLLFIVVSACSPSSQTGEPAVTDRGAVVVIGATARSAKELIPQALAAGYSVIGIARRPEAVEFDHERFTVVKGDVYDLASIEAALSGDEAVVSVIGWAAPRDENATGEHGLYLNVEVTEEVDLYSMGGANIIQAMKNKGNRRLLFTTSAGVKIAPPTENPGSPSEAADPTAWRRQMYFWNVRRVYDDFRRAEAIIRESGLDYTILRPVQLMQEPARGDYKAATGFEYPAFTSITYADFAAFIIEQLESTEFAGEAVAIYSDTEF